VVSARRPQSFQPESMTSFRTSMREVCKGDSHAPEWHPPETGSKRHAIVTTVTTHDRHPSVSSPLLHSQSQPQVIPTIRLTAPTPSEPNMSCHQSNAEPRIAETIPTPLPPKANAGGEPVRKCLVPKQSKLGLLGSSTREEREQDLSDVVQCITGSMRSTGRFKIYVDPADDPEIGDILLVKKKKSRAALNGMSWGTLGEVTNVPPIMKPKESKEKGGQRRRKGY